MLVPLAPHHESRPPADCMTSNRTVRLLHLSDVHFGRDHCFGAPISRSAVAGLDRDLLGTLIAHCDKSAEIPDAIVVSGDLTSTGTKPEFQEAAAFLSELMKRLHVPDDRLIVVPGNHDVTWGRDDSIASSAEFESFVSRMFHAPVEDLAIRSLRVGNVFLMGLDLTRLETPKRRGVGFAGLDQLAKAHDKISRDSNPDDIRILVIHHHLLPVAWQEDLPENCPHSFTLDASSVIAWAQEHGFAAILHGHQHQSFLSTFHLSARPGGPLIIAGAPSVGAKTLPPHGANGYHWLLIDNNRITISSLLLTEAHEFRTDALAAYVKEVTGVFAVSALPYTRTSDEATVAEIRAVCKIAASHVAHTLGQSFGPKGGLRGVVSQGGHSHARDGQRIVQSLTSGSDPLQGRVIEAVANMMQEASQHLGDGRKTAAIIAATTITEAIEAIEHGADETAVCNGIAEASHQARKAVLEMGVPIASADTLTRVGMAAAMGRRDVGDMLTNAMSLAGKDGIIVLEKAVSAKTESGCEVIQCNGMEISGRFPSWLDSAEAGTQSWEHCLVAAGNAKIQMSDAIHLLELARAAGQPLIIFCESISSEASDIIALNLKKANVRCIAVTGEASGQFRWQEMYRDAATFTGATFIEAEPAGLASRVMKDDLGVADEVTLSSEKLVLIGGHGHPDVLRNFVDNLRRRLEDAESDYERERIHFRIAQVLNQVIRVKINGASVADAEIEHDLVADALRATSSAIETGIVSGGGASYFRAGLALSQAVAKDDFSSGIKAFSAGLQAPLRWFAQQSGFNPNDITVAGSCYDIVSNYMCHDLTCGPLDAVGIVRGVISLASDTAERVLKTRSWEVARS